jgi:hypothetical protein
MVLRGDTPDPSNKEQEINMSRFARLAVLAASLLSLFAVLSSTAGAVTWHNTGDTHFAATGGAGTLSSTAVTLGCTGSDVTGRVTGAEPFVGATLSVDATIGFTGCTLSGQSFGVECGVTFTGTSWTAGAPAVTSGAVDVTCGFYLSGTKLCHLEGQIPAHYVNASGTAAGRLTVTTGALTTTNGSVSSCPMGNGDSAHLTPLTFGVVDTVQPLGPVITRTA